MRPFFNPYKSTPTMVYLAPLLVSCRFDINKYLMFYVSIINPSLYFSNIIYMSFDFILFILDKLMHNDVFFHIPATKHT